LYLFWSQANLLRPLSNAIPFQFQKKKKQWTDAHGDLAGSILPPLIPVVLRAGAPFWMAPAPSRLTSGDVLRIALSLPALPRVRSRGLCVCVF
jgi:hypothetical protein